MSIVLLKKGVNRDRDILGGKAWSIQNMLSMGIPVPPAFVITTDECARYVASGRNLPHDVRSSINTALQYLETATNRTFGKGPRALLLSVRSGAAISMPGMMDTILNLGINADIETALADETSDGQFAANTRRRFEDQYHQIVGRRADAEPWSQLIAAIGAVFDSWNSRRAIAYRSERRIDQTLGTAVTVQAMVFGNLDERSGTGVLFSRNPLSGDSSPFGEWLPRGQGEDVVSGSHTPLPLDALAKSQPAVHRELIDHTRQLEKRSKDVQDIEFTVEAGKLWLLQSRTAKRSPRAAIRIAIAMKEEGLISVSEAANRVSNEQIAQACRPHIDPVEARRFRPIANGTPASPGVCSGTVLWDVDEAQKRAEAGDFIILARPTTDPQDVPTMMVVSGVLTELGGSTSHAAVVSREMGVPCIVGCGAGQLIQLNGRVATVDATEGKVFDGHVGVVFVSSDAPDIVKIKAWKAASGDLTADV